MMSQSFPEREERDFFSSVLDGIQMIAFSGKRAVCREGPAPSGDKALSALQWHMDFIVKDTRSPSGAQAGLVLRFAFAEAL